MTIPHADPAVERLFTAVVNLNLDEVKRLAPTTLGWAQPQPAVPEMCPVHAVLRHARTSRHEAVAMEMLNALLAPLPEGALRHDTFLLNNAIQPHLLGIALALLPYTDPSGVYEQRFPLALAASLPFQDFDPELLDVLLERCDPNMANGKGETALMLAAVDNRTAGIARLLEVPGLNLNQTDHLGRTALHRIATSSKGAVLGNHGLAAMNLLLAAGADPDLPDQQGRTVLTTAIVQKHSPWLVKRLLDHHDRPPVGGRPLNLLHVDADGFRPHDLARRVGFMPALWPRLDRACQAQEQTALRSALDDLNVGPVDLGESPKTTPRGRARL